MTDLFFVLPAPALFALFCLAVMVREAWVGVISLNGGGTIRRDERPHLFWFINICRGLPGLILVIVIVLRSQGLLR